MTALRQLHRQGEEDSPRATMLRVLWVRAEHEDARIETELTHLRDDLVVARAIVTLAGGASASGYAAEPLDTADDPSATIERSETRAIGRALDILGYIVAPEQALAGADRPAPAAPVEGTMVEEPVAAPEPEREPQPEPAARAAPSSPPTVINALRNVPLRARAQGQVAEPVAATGVDPRTGELLAPEAASAPRIAEPVRQREPAAPAEERADDSDEPPLEDYSWTHFWKWARSHDLTTRAQVEERLGHTINGRNPGDVRAELHEHGVPLD